MDTPVVSDAELNLRAVGRRLLDAVDELCVRQCRIIREQVAAYRDETLVTEEDLFAASRAQAVFILQAMGSARPDVDTATRVGRLRANQGMPLADVMSAYRAGSQFLWEQLARAIDDAGLTRRELQIAASQAWQYQATFTDAMADAYRDVATENMIERDRQLSALVGGILHGGLPADTTVRQAARLLGLPDSGHFVVVAMEAVPQDYRPLQAIQRALHAKGLPSAWRREPDAHVGMVALPEPTPLARLEHILTEHRTRRIGISPLYDGHPPPRTALNYATAALMAATDDDPVVSFDTNPFAVAAIADPETMGHYRTLVLGSLNDLAPEDKRLLVDTFRRWVHCGGSVTEAARELFCHPNTVRYRLRRLRQHTGRDTARPRDVAELHLAIESDHRLPPRDDRRCAT